MTTLSSTTSVEDRGGLDCQSTFKSNDCERVIPRAQSAMHYLPQNVAVIRGRCFNKHPRISNVPRSGSPG